MSEEYIDKSPRRGRPAKSEDRVTREYRLTLLADRISKGEIDKFALAREFDVSPRQIQHDIEEILKQFRETRFEDVEDYRDLEVQRLDRLYSIVLARISEDTPTSLLLGLVKTATGIVDQKSKLLGLQSTKFEVKQDIQVTTNTIQTLDIAHVAAILDQAKAFELPSPEPVVIEVEAKECLEPTQQTSNLRAE